MSDTPYLDAYLKLKSWKEACKSRNFIRYKPGEYTVKFQMRNPCQEIILEPNFRYEASGLLYTRIIDT